MIREVFDYARRLPVALEGVIERVEALSALMRSSLPLQARQPPPDYFVQLVAFGLMEVAPAAPADPNWRPADAHDVSGFGRVELTRVVGGASGFVSSDAPSLTLQFQVSKRVRALELLVFCDLSKVFVRGLFIGHDFVGLNLGNGSPIGFARLAEPGVLISANALLRK